MATSPDQIVRDRRQERGIALAVRWCRRVPERYFESTISAYFYQSYLGRNSPSACTGSYYSRGIRMSSPCSRILTCLDNIYFQLQKPKWPYKKQYSRRGGGVRSHPPPRLHCIATASAPWRHEAVIF